VIRHVLHVAVIGAGALLVVVLLLRGFVAGGAIATAISVAVFAVIDWLATVATSGDQH
jgi:hypothetical protein